VYINLNWPNGKFKANKISYSIRFSNSIEIYLLNMPIVISLFFNFSNTLYIYMCDSLHLSIPQQPNYVHIAFKNDYNGWLKYNVHITAAINTHRKHIYCYFKLHMPDYCLSPVPPNILYNKYVGM